MATDAELLQALQQAHNAGDTQAAIAIAKAIHAQAVSPVVSPAPPQDIAQTAAHKPPAYDPSAGGSTLQIGPWDTGIKTGQGTDRFLSGMGESFANTGRGISQMFGGQTAADTDEQRRLDAPLNQTGAGIAGNIAGEVAQTALPGAGAMKAVKLAGRAAPFLTAVAPELGGAAVGAAAPTGTGDSRLENAAIGAGTALAGSGLGEVGQNLLRTGKNYVTPAAQQAYQMAQKYGIDLTVPQLSNSPFVKYYSSMADTMLPFSGAGAKKAEQYAQFNNAVGQESGIPAAQGAITPDMVDAAKDRVGSVIGDIAQRNNAVPTSDDVQKLMATLQETKNTSTPEVANAVEQRLKQIFAHVNPQTGEIPGPAWRQANTSLQRQIKSTTDGDMRHYLGQVQDTFHDMMTNNMSPADQQMWGQARGQYRNLMSIAPLAEKGGNNGISPALLRGRLIAAKNNRGNLSDLADLGQEQIKDAVPNSGTAQRELIAGMVGLGGHQMFPGATAATAAAVVGNNLANRILKSNLAAKYYMGRLPDAAAAYVDPVAKAMGPAGAIGAGAALNGQAAINQAAQSGGLDDRQGHADGGTVEPKKSSFWDLVAQAVKEATSPSPPAPQPTYEQRTANAGTQPSGSVGADFDSNVNAQVAAQDH